MLAVVREEARLTEDAGGLETAEAFQEVQAALQRVELGLREGVLVAGGWLWVLVPPG
jgi:hypothetical protein